MEPKEGTFSAVTLRHGPNERHFSNVEIRSFRETLTGAQENTVEQLKELGFKIEAGPPLPLRWELKGTEHKIARTERLVNGTMLPELIEDVQVTVGFLPENLVSAK